MDFHMKQWRYQHESEQPYPAKIPKLLVEPHQQPSGGSALPLFVSEPNSKINALSAFSDSTSATTKYTKMGSYFSLAQWQELELQAMIFRYMLAGAAVPPELLQPIKKSLIHSPPYFLPHPLQNYSHFQPALLQSGYWSRAAMDPEPGRCRRTDGKKWRCSRDVVAGQKYCERHLHRGRNRSRKPVELPTPLSTPVGGGLATGGGGGGGSSALSVTTPIASQSMTTVSLKSPFDLHQLNQRSSGLRNENKAFETQNNGSGDGRSDGHVLRHFFDDWPRPVNESDNAESNSSTMNSATSLSISMPGNPSSDVSLKLSTGNEGDPCDRSGGNMELEQPQLNWAAGWTSTNPVPSMGGPLAEALRSSTSSSSPTSVLLLNQLPRGAASQSNFISSRT
ncbi:Growth-regulating factor [Quillaja saponaria]|uniref:Growth-regulating factor n=1 Tax=Quillaja saponaria TaxID=32244 RepID=A0AAD7PYG5_QUISA|nr:Growth-regulating factor [Quillaja saponaria]